MEINIKILLLNMLYERLGLQKIEEELFHKGVVPKEIKFDDISIQHVQPKYFLLENDIYLENLTTEERKKLETLMLSLNEENEASRNQLYQFLEENKLKILCPNIPDRYICYGPISNSYLAPRDAIVLGFHYIEYPDPFDRTKHDELEELIVDKLNYIQEEVGPANNLSVATISYNEIDFNKEKMM